MGGIALKMVLASTPVFVIVESETRAPTSAALEANVGSACR